jgi:hypothetical protein
MTPLRARSAILPQRCLCIRQVRPLHQPHPAPEAGAVHDHAECVRGPVRLVNQRGVQDRALAG